MTQHTLQLLLAGLAGVLAVQVLRDLRRPLPLALDGLAADAPRWRAELTERNDD